MRLIDLVECSERVAASPGRNQKIRLLAELIRQVPAGQIQIAIAFLSGALRQGRIGIGPAAIRDAYTEGPAETPSLVLREVDLAFEEVAAIKGKGSARETATRLRGLFSRASERERRFLVQLLVGELRQGALEGLMVEAVARAVGVPPGKVRRAAMTTGDLGKVAEAAVSDGEAGLASFAVQLFRPVQPMLAQPADGVNDALERLGEAVFEYKVDGARIQIHKSGDDVQVFSRRLRDVTGAVPEVVQLIRRFPAHELILDGEVIALRQDGTPHLFQVTMGRFGSKRDVDFKRQELPLTPFLFDLLYVDGTSLLDEPLTRRFEMLDAHADARYLMPRMLTSAFSDAALFLERAMKAGHEGVMAKAPHATYEAGSRGSAWLKVKPAHTLDLVVLAADWGHGRRHGWLSNLHLGAREDDGGFVMLGKTFKGMTDKMLTWQTKKLLELEVARDRYTVFVRPELVVEVAFNDVQASSQYPGGLALRFARVKRYRPDKGADGADTIETVRDIFRRSTGEPSASQQS